MRGKSVPANVKVVTKRASRAQTSFPRPVEPFDDPLARC
jgi:hypothetical protein